MSTKEKLHPRSKHRNPYDFKELSRAIEGLKKFLIKTPSGSQSIDFTNPQAVKTLNQAILKKDYDLDWDLPDGFLCPPIPGRADYIHYISDLINQGSPSHQINVLDIGTGASCIYPLLGHKIYNWQFVGADINPQALEHCQKLIDQNHLNKFITLRLQTDKEHIFSGVIKDGEFFDVSMCNPPFHISAKTAQEANERKWRNLNKTTKVLNFGGQADELYCKGGELRFIKTMIHESKHAPIKWVTCLVSKKEHINPLLEELKLIKVKHTKVISMGQGQKISHILAWSFHN